jgi:hypothetical protein
MLMMMILLPLKENLKRNFIEQKKKKRTKSDKNYARKEDNNQRSYPQSDK